MLSATSIVECPEVLMPEGIKANMAGTGTGTILQHLFRYGESKGLVCGVWLDDEGEETAILTYRCLLEKAYQLAFYLRTVLSIAPGERVVLVMDNCPEFQVAFIGCMLAGVIPIPTTPLNPYKMQSAIDKLGLQFLDAKANFFIASPNMETALRTFRWSWPTEMTSNPPRQLSVSEPLPEEEHAWLPVAQGYLSQLDLDQLAFIQYTSGSTGQPKGVCISHSNIKFQLEKILAPVGFRYLHSEDPPTAEDDADGLASAERAETYCSWLPIYHDLGLIGAMMYCFVSGYRLVHISPLAFMKQPHIWLLALSKYQVSVTFSPNFAFSLTARRVRDASKKVKALLTDRLELSKLQVVASGGEPVRAEAVSEFYSALKQYGLSAECTVGCGYGQAESVLVLADCCKWKMGHPYAFMSPEDSVVPNVVGYCRASDSVDLRIVDPTTRRELRDNEVGEIWARSGTVADMGFWGRVEETVTTFRAEIVRDDNDVDEPSAAAAITVTHYLRTGDLGFYGAATGTGRSYEQRCLFIVGRHKDMIIIGGHNIYPQDLEYDVETLAPKIIRPGCVAVFRTTIEVPDDNKPLSPPSPGGLAGGSSRRGGGKVVEGVDVVAEVRDSHLGFDVYKQTASDICKHIPKEFDGVKVFKVTFVKARSIPKTSSGKIRRSDTRLQDLAGTLMVVHVQMRVLQKNTDGEYAIGGVNAGVDIEVPTTRTEMLTALILLLHSAGVSEFSPAIDKQLRDSTGAYKISFPDLGLNSIAASQLVQLLADHIQVEVSAHDLFQCKSIGTFVDSLCAKLNIAFSEDEAENASRYGLTVGAPLTDSSASSVETKLELQKTLYEADRDADRDGKESLRPMTLQRVVLAFVVQFFGLCVLVYVFLACFVPIVWMAESIVSFYDVPFLALFTRYNVAPRFNDVDNVYLTKIEPVEGDRASISSRDVSLPPPYGDYEPLIANKYAALFVAIPLMIFTYAICMTIVSIALKWVLLGRVKPGVYPLWGHLHARLWFVRMFSQCAEFMMVQWLPDSIALVVYHKLMGMEIDWDASIDMCVGLLGHGMWDLISIGRGCEIHSTVVFAAQAIKGDKFVLGRIRVEDGVKVKRGKVLEGCVEEEEGASSHDDIESREHTSTIVEEQKKRMMKTPTKKKKKLNFHHILRSLRSLLIWDFLYFGLIGSCILPGIFLRLTYLDKLEIGFVTIIPEVLFLAVIFMICWFLVCILFKRIFVWNPPGTVFKKGSLRNLARTLNRRINVVVNKFCFSLISLRAIQILYFQCIGLTIQHNAVISTMNVVMEDPEAISVGALSLLGGGCIIRTSEVLSKRRDTRDGTVPVVSEAVDVGDDKLTFYYTTTDDNKVIGAGSTLEDNSSIQSKKHVYDGNGTAPVVSAFEDGVANAGNASVSDIGSEGYGAEAEADDDGDDDIVIYQTTISSNVVIGAGAVIGAGSKLEDNSSVQALSRLASHSVVEEWQIVSGMPGKIYDQTLVDYQPVSAREHEVPAFLTEICVQLCIGVWVCGLFFMTYVILFSVSFYIQKSSNGSCPPSIQMTVAVTASMMGSLLIAILTKWIFRCGAGRKSAGEFRRDEITIFTRVRTRLPWVVVVFTRTFFGWWMYEGPWIVVFNKLLGADVHSTAMIQSFSNMLDWDFIHMAPGSVEDVASMLCPHIVSGSDRMEFVDLYIGDFSSAGANSWIPGGTNLSNGACIGHSSRPLPDMRYDQNLTYSGVPAQHIKV